MWKESKMKKILVIFGAWISFCMSAWGSDTRSAMEVIHRIAGDSVPVSLSLKPHDGETYFRYWVKDGTLCIEGSDNVALCRGFYDYVKSNGMGMYTWSGNNISLPARLKEKAPVEVVSPFANHYYFNVVTFGYTMPYWDWERWEKEIDWMALHGINMPLALVAYEAILARVWKKMGLTDEEINYYFCGPAHLPWMRMGNISGVDSPLNQDWHDSQVALQHKILRRMKSLGMKPICPGFSGFVPPAFKRLYPDLELMETKWGGRFHNWMIAPHEQLFVNIGKAFIEEWEREFGANKFYLVDSFNEMQVPFPKKGTQERYDMAAFYGEKVYHSIQSANPDAVWVMQGWMFGYQRDIWDYDTLGALVSRVPDDKMLLLDLAVDYNKCHWHSQVNWEFYKGFFGKQWVYSVIPNMGGKTGMTGVLEFYANGHLEALNSPNKGCLVAFGMAPEGIENNEVLYELVTDAGWGSQHIDVRQWLRKYSINRYGDAPSCLLQGWDYLLESVYGTFTDHPRYNWQFRPGLRSVGSINLSPKFFKGIECFAAASGKLGESEFYQNDLIEMAALYLGGKSEFLINRIEQEYLSGDTLRAVSLEKRLEGLMLGMDSLLSRHPLLRLDRWLGYASKAARTEQQEQQYLTNARRIVTIWGPPVDDYSARVWSGLVKDYYYQRWKHYFQSRRVGRPFDFPTWEREWVENGKNPVDSLPNVNVVMMAHRLLDSAKDIDDKGLKLRSSAILGTWSLKADDEKEYKFSIKPRILRNMKGFEVECLKATQDVSVLSYKLEADGVVVASGKLSADKKNLLTVKFRLPENIRANNGCNLTLSLKTGAKNCAGIVRRL